MTLENWRLIRLVPAVGCALLLMSCASLPSPKEAPDTQHSSAWGNRYHEVSGSEFLELAAKPMGSAFDTTFIGATRLRAYLSVWSAKSSSLGGGENIYSCLLKDLPAEISARIRAGENPWPK